jgi:hypothetical protein
MQICHPEANANGFFSKRVGHPLAAARRQNVMLRRTKKRNIPIALPVSQFRQCSCKEIVMSIFRARMRYNARHQATTLTEIGTLALLFGVVGFIVFLAWGAGPNGSRVAHTPLTHAETTGVGGSYALPRRAAPIDAVELTR